MATIRIQNVYFRRALGAMAINHAFYTVRYADRQVNFSIRSALLIRTSFAKNSIDSQTK